MPGAQYKQRGKITAWEQVPMQESEADTPKDEEEDDAQSKVSHGTKNTLDRKDQKYLIYLKLVGMLLLPCVLLLVLLVVVMVDYRTFTQDDVQVVILARYISKINAFTGRTQIERGTSSVYMGSGDTNMVTQLAERRLITDAKGKDFVDYLEEQKDALPRTFLIEASACRHFIVHDVPKIRLVVDSLNKAALGKYTAGIAKCHSLISRFPDYTDNGPKAAAIVSITTLLNGKEVAGVCRAVVSTHLGTGKVTQATKKFQDKAQLRINAFLNAFVTAVPPHIAKSVTALLNSEIGVNWKAATQDVLTKPEDALFDGATASATYFDTYSKFISALSGIISDNIVLVEEETNHSAYSAWLYCLIVVTCFTPFVAAWAGRAISVPFSRLGKVKQKLKAEKTKHSLHNEAVTKFVPFETLELLGLSDIVEVEVGLNQIRRMTIMFSYLHNFNLLAARLGADNIVSHLNSWLDGVVDKIKHNRGLVDKFMGDGLLAFFYKPEESVVAGIQMVEWMQNRNKESAASGAMALEFGVGINTGDVCVGTIGSDTRMTTTAIGDEVNVAARIQSCTKMYGTQLLVSESARNFANSNSYSFRYMGQTTVKGRPDPVSIYESLDCLAPAELALKKQTSVTFSAALKALNGEDSAQALKLFREVIELNPSDQAAQWYIKNITQGPQEFVK